MAEGRILDLDAGESAAKDNPAKRQKPDPETFALPSTDPEGSGSSAAVSLSVSSVLDLVHQKEADIDNLVLENVAKDYRLMVNESMVKTRDNRLTAKDKEITSLKASIDLEELMANDKSEEIQTLRSCLEQAGNLLKAREQEMETQFQEHGRLAQDQVALLKHIDKLKAECETLRAQKDELEVQLAQKTWSLDAKDNDGVIVGQLKKFGRLLTSLAPQSEQSRMPTTFLTLPAEMRNEIYKLALVLKQPIDFWPIRLPDTPPEMCRGDFVKAQLAKINTNLLLTCRQVHHEAAGVLYGCNRFRFSDKAGIHGLYVFLHSINTNCQYVTHLSVHLPYECFTGTNQPTEVSFRTDMQIFCLGMKIPLDSPVGPKWTDEFETSRRVIDIMHGMRNLRSINIVVTHSARVEPQMAFIISPLLFNGPLFLDLPGSPVSRQPEKNLIFVRRNPNQARFVMGWDLDDHDFMGRDLMRRSGNRNGWNFKMAVYGCQANGMSYVVDGGEGLIEVFASPYTDIPYSPKDPAWTVLLFCQRTIMLNPGVRKAICDAFTVGEFVINNNKSSFKDARQLGGRRLVLWGGQKLASTFIAVKAMRILVSLALGSGNNLELGFKAIECVFRGLVAGGGPISSDFGRFLKLCVEEAK